MCEKPELQEKAHTSTERKFDYFCQGMEINLKCVIV